MIIPKVLKLNKTGFQAQFYPPCKFWISKVLKKKKKLKLNLNLHLRIYTYEIDLDDNSTNNVLQEISLEGNVILWYILTFCFVF